MAKREVNQCDICGANDSEENRVSCRVTLTSAKPRHDPSAYFASVIWGGGSSEAQDQLDLCRDCSGPLLAMLRERVAQRRLEEKRLDRIKPSEPIANDTLKAFFAGK